MVKAPRLLETLVIMAEAVALLEILLNVSETFFGMAHLALYDLFGIRHRQWPPQFLFDIAYCSGGDPTNYIGNHGSVDARVRPRVHRQYYPPTRAPVVLTPIAPPDVPLRALGHGLAASAIPARLLNVSSAIPLNVSYDASAMVLHMAVALIKRATSTTCGDRRRDRARGPQLGRNFMCPHLPQLLVLWRNALPKPTSKDTGAGGSCCTGPAQRADVAANHFVSPAVQDALGISDPATQEALQQQNGQNRNGHSSGCPSPRAKRSPAAARAPVRCRARAQYHRSDAGDSAPIMRQPPSLRVRMDMPARGMLCMPSSGAFTGIRASGDGYARSVIFIEVGGDDLEEDSRQIEEGRTEDLLDPDSVEVAIDSNLEFAPGTCFGSLQARSAVLVPGAGIQCEVSLGRTSASVHLGRGHGHRTFRAAAPSARLLPLQDLTSTVKILTLLLESAAFFINAVAVVLALRQIMASTQPCGAKSAFGSAPDALVDRDLVLSAVSSQSIGRLANVAGTTFFAGQIKLISWALMYLGNDPRPVVHFWALQCFRTRPARHQSRISANAPDPAYDDAALVLERHQTPQYTAALTPRFSADSTPEIFPSTVDECAVLLSPWIKPRFAHVVLAGDGRAES
ncbi:hypothetical protein DFH08DRAFT_971801 [Mycena albidolilacea]|uniref:Uncharacterized protein n=1 Tax=Mycena albidolilacea TaxID=1033008 RepID=A0AAD7EFQ0_9AGAR|nr:hypothetical protein DFH08DRAFT_971801 [Mycena albidolilacea]